MSGFLIVLTVIIFIFFIVFVLHRYRKESDEGLGAGFRKRWRESPVDEFFILLTPLLIALMPLLLPLIGSVMFDRNTVPEGSGGGGPGCPSVLACYRAEKPSGNIEGFLNVSFDTLGEVTSVEVEGSMSEGVKRCLREQAATHFAAQTEKKPQGTIQCSWAGKYVGESHDLLTSVKVLEAGHQSL